MAKTRNKKVEKKNDGVDNEKNAPVQNNTPKEEAKEETKVEQKTVEQNQDGLAKTPEDKEVDTPKATDAKVSESKDEPVEEKSSLSGHNIDGAFKAIINVEKSIPSTEISAAGYSLIESLRQECSKEEGNEAVPAFIKNIGSLFSDTKLNETSIGLPSLMWNWSSESRIAYETIVAVAVAVNNDGLEDLSKLNVLKGFQGTFSIIGEKVVANYFD